jgi:hypothetical protein
LCIFKPALRAAGAAEVLHPDPMDGARVRGRVMARPAVQVTGGAHYLYLYLCLYI